MTRGLTADLCPGPENSGRLLSVYCAQVPPGHALAGLFTTAGAGSPGVGCALFGEAPKELLFQGEHSFGVVLERRL